MTNANKLVGLIMLLVSVVVFALSILAFSRVRANALVEAFTPTPTDTSTPTPTNTPTNIPTLATVNTPTVAADTPTPTATPTATPTPTNTSIPTETPTTIPISDAVVIASNGLNLRSGPGTDYDIIDFLKKDDTLSIQGRIADNGWIQVVSDNRSVSGWVSASSELVQINLNLNDVSIISPSPTPIPTATPTFTVTPAFVSSSYPPPIPIKPDNGSGSYGTFPPLTWTWDGELADDEYFEVRIWHESITDYHPALGWVKEPPFDFNISQERPGKYYWTVIVIKGENAKLKDWIIQSGWPYQMWDGELVAELSQESEQRFFMYTPTNSGVGGGNGTSISNSGGGGCGEPPCD